MFSRNRAKIMLVNVKLSSKNVCYSMLIYCCLKSFTSINISKTNFMNPCISFDYLCTLPVEENISNQCFGYDAIQFYSSFYIFSNYFL